MTPPRPPTDALVHVAARRAFEPFADLCFHHLNRREPLTRGWHLSAMAHALEQAESGACRRLLITIPPRHMKTLLASIALPAWALGRDPTRRIICASYGQDLATRFSRDFRSVMTSGWYAQVFPEAARYTRANDTEFATQAGGFRYATALGGTVTGLGADIIIIDDLMKAADAPYPEARERARRFIDETLLSRLDDQRAGIVIAIQQRLHEDDPAAHLIAKGGYRHLNIPARAVEDELIPMTLGRMHHRRIGDLIDPVRLPETVLDELRREMGARAFEAQYQQNPSAPNGGTIRWERISFYDQAPERDTLTCVVQCWDVAMTDNPRSDYSVGTTWAHDGESWLFLDLVRVRLAFPDLLDRVRAERRKWSPAVILVEDAGIGTALLQQMRRDRETLNQEARSSRPFEVVAAPARLGKVERMSAHVDRLYSGHAKLPRQAPWLADLRHELLAFPDSRYDDQVDSISHFLEWSVGRYARAQTGQHPERPATGAWLIAHYERMGYLRGRY